MASSKGLLDLSDDVFLTVLSKVPCDVRTLTNMRLTCKRFNILMQSRSLQMDILKANFASAGEIWYNKQTGLPSLYKAAQISSETQKVIKEVAQCLDGEAHGMHPDDVAPLHAVVEKGLHLIGWLAERPYQQTFERHGAVKVANVSISVLLTRYNFSLSALLSIRIAIYAMWHQLFPSCAARMLGSPCWRENAPTGDDPEEVRGMLFVAFEAAVLHLVCVHEGFWTWEEHFDEVQETAYHIFSGMTDLLGEHMTASIRMDQFPKAAFLESRTPWRAFSDQIRRAMVKTEEAAFDPLFDEDFHSSIDWVMFTSIKDAMCDGHLARWILERLDLNEEIRRVHPDLSSQLSPMYTRYNISQASSRAANAAIQDAIDAVNDGLMTMRFENAEEKRFLEQLYGDDLPMQYNSQSLGQNSSTSHLDWQQAYSIGQAQYQGPGEPPSHYVSQSQVETRQATRPEHYYHFHPQAYQSSHGHESQYQPQPTGHTVLNQYQVPWQSVYQYDQEPQQG